jgi:pimeloyl-ACP methyl ester carboxylesterase
MTAHTHRARRSTKSDEASGPTRGRRVLRRITLFVVVLLLLVYGAAGWYVSGEIIDGLRIARSDIVYDTDVLAVEDSQITLGTPDERDVLFDQDAVMGLRWEGGYGQVGPASSVDATTQVRPFTVLEGSPPPLGAEVADFHSFAFPGDPSILGVEFETVTYTGPLGDFEAWHVPGEADTWIIAVHGRSADRTEFLRFLDSTKELDYPILVIRYRNDEDSPVSDGSLILAGQEEWEDVAAAADFATSQGATGLVVHGASMGGALTLSYALEAPPGLIRGLILEAAPADLREIVSLRSGEALPIGGPIGDSILAAGRLFTWLRTGLDFDQVDYVDRAGELDMPVLWFHGTEDTTVPFTVGEQFRDARPDLVEFHSLPDAVHVRAWNEDPQAYQEIVTDFLDEVAPGD